MIVTSETPDIILYQISAITVFRNNQNYILTKWWLIIVPKCWTSVFLWNASNYNFPQCCQLYFFERQDNIISWNSSSYNSPNYNFDSVDQLFFRATKRRLLLIIWIMSTSNIFGKCQQLYFPKCHFFEMTTMNTFSKCQPSYLLGNAVSYNCPKWFVISWNDCNYNFPKI